MKKYLFAAFFLLPLSTQAANKMSSRQVVEAFYTDLITNTGNDAHLAERAALVVSKNWQSEPVPFGGPGLDGLVATVSGYHKLIPDIKWTPQDIRQAGPNHYVVRSIGTGTPDADFLKIGDSFKKGNRFEIMSIDIHTLKNGKIVQTYHVEDWRKAISQLSQ